MESTAPPLRMRARAGRFSTCLAVVLGSGAITCAFGPPRTFSLVHGPSSKVAPATDETLAGSSKFLALGYSAISQERPAGYQVHSPLSAVGILVAATIAGFSYSYRHRRHTSLHAASADDEMDDDLLIRAGLRNLLGAEENKIAAKLEKACQVAVDMERCMNDLEVKNKVTMEELVDVRAHSQELEEERGSMIAELSEKTQELEQLQDSLSSVVEKSQKEVSELQSILETTEEAKKQSIEELQAAKDAVESAQMEKDAVEVRASNLTVQLEDSERQLAVFGKQVEELEAKLAESQDRFAENAQAKDTEIADLQSQLAHSEGQLADFKEHVEAVNAKLAEAQNNFTEINRQSEEEIAGLQSKLEESQREASYMVDELQTTKDAMGRVQEENKELSGLKPQIEELTGKLADAENAGAKLQSKLEASQKEAAYMAEELQTAKDAMERMENENRELDGLKTEIEELTAKLANSRNRSQDAEPESGAQITALQGQLQETQEEAEQVNGELKTAKQAVVRMHKQKLAAEAKCDKLTAKLKAMEQGDDSGSS